MRFFFKYNYYTFAFMQKLRKILLPFSWLYSGVTRLRNELYNRGIFESTAYDVPVICVGNLSVGGTGKSPMVEYLIDHLKDEYCVATLSRGYKRSTSGFYLLTGTETAREVGDEPLQFKKKYPNILVAVDEVRTRGIEKLLALPQPPEVILLDDAFQHRRVTPKLNILLTSYENLYSQDKVLPAGNLREPKSGSRRAHIVVVTKCPPGLGKIERQRVSESLDLLPEQSLFFASIGYSEQIFNQKGAMALSKLQEKEFVLVTGIAKPLPLVEYLQEQDLKFQHESFPDHHNFTDKQLRSLTSHELILTTEKDYMRLQGEFKDEQLYYIPIKTVFLASEPRFKSIITSSVTKK